tara:strand:+ start:95 stop:514 length:420 start_codon:yes stop_codon:yes gene_type:complete
MNISEKILAKYSLRKTNFRIELLNLFQKSQSSLTAEDIKTKAKSTNDKVTIYRALEIFEKNGLIHRVPDKNNLSRYALCQEKCSPIKHHHNHAHFICNNCSKTFCLDNMETPIIKKFKNFTITKSKLVLEGECPDCKKP